MKNFEIEIKFRLNKTAEDFLKDKNFLEEKSGKDVYYDLEDFSLFLKGAFIRLRNNKSLDFKYDFSDDDSHRGCSSYDFSIPIQDSEKEIFSTVVSELGLKQPDVSDFSEFLKINSLKSFIEIEKSRKVFSDGCFNFVVDSVEGLGKFIEIEKETTNEEEIPKIKEKILAIANKLGLEEIKTGYVELMLLKKNPELYKKGKYKM